MMRRQRVLVLASLCHSSFTVLSMISPRSSADEVNATHQVHIKTMLKLTNSHLCALQTGPLQELLICMPCADSL